MTTFNSAKQKQMQAQMKYPGNRIPAVENKARRPHQFLEGAGYHNSTWPQEIQKEERVTYRT